MRVGVAVSGGVDSLCALYLLKEAGHEVFALHGKFLERPALTAEAARTLRDACFRLGAELFIFDLQKEFKALVEAPFLDAYASGRTPNPCAVCNRDLKFGLLMDRALALGADTLATGHYAALAANPYSGDPPFIIAAGSDSRKDQSYFLALLRRECLSRILFPLAKLDKSSCRKLAAESGLEIPLPAESHDICFIDTSYGAYLRKNSPDLFAPHPGPVYLYQENREPVRMGSHAGLWNYTEGQRRGLNIPHSEPLYVLSKDLQNNALFVGGRASVGMAGCEAAHLNFHVDPADWPGKMLVKLRFSHAPMPAAIGLSGERAAIRLDEPAFPSAPGQIAAFYDDFGRLLGGGIIEKIHLKIDL